MIEGLCCGINRTREWDFLDSLLPGALSTYLRMHAAFLLVGGAHEGAQLDVVSVLTYETIFPPAL